MSISLRTTPELPIRWVVLRCDRCGTEDQVDLMAVTVEAAYAQVRRVAVAAHGWKVTKAEDICSLCASLEIS